MEFIKSINDLQVHAHYSDEMVETVYLPLLRHLTDLQKQKNGRILAFLAAPPGSGKTTLSMFFQHLSEQTPGITPLVSLGMDGFHHYMSYLNSHTIVRDGETIPLVKIKGAPPSYDLEKMTDKIRRIAAGENCGWPAYSRKTHDPVEDAVTVDSPIVLIEGNYLLLDEPGWRELKQYADYTIRIAPDENVLKERLIERKAASGMPREEVIRHVEFSDLVNVKLCLEKSLPADLVIESL